MGGGGGHHPLFALSEGVEMAPLLWVGVACLVVGCVGAMIIACYVYMDLRP